MTRERPDGFPDSALPVVQPRPTPSGAVLANRKLPTTSFQWDDRPCILATDFTFGPRAGHPRRRGDGGPGYGGDRGSAGDGLLQKPPRRKPPPFRGGPAPARPRDLGGGRLSGTSPDTALGVVVGGCISTHRGGYDDCARSARHAG